MHLLSKCKKLQGTIEKENETKDKNNKLALLPTHIHPHAFRHTQASMLIFKGMDLETVSKRLGHKDQIITGKTYSHLMKEADKTAANILEDVLAS